VRILPSSSSKSAPERFNFQHFEVQFELFELQIELSLQARAHFANLILLSLQFGAHFADLNVQKCSETVGF
jgi:hypothetical protein